MVKLRLVVRCGIEVKVKDSGKAAGRLRTSTPTGSIFRIPDLVRNESHQVRVMECKGLQGHARCSARIAAANMQCNRR